MKRFNVVVFLLLVFLCSSIALFAQTPGLIYKQSNSALGRSVLDPNGDGFTSATAGGFTGTDYGANSELNMIPLPIFTAEPVGDLTTGSSGGATDMVSFGGNTNQSCYILLKTVGGVQYVVVRFRLGGASTSAKGYSLLLDVDGVFGSQYSAKNNPGFEKEIVLETGNTGMVAIYTHNASGSTLSHSYAIDAYQQRSIALSTVSSDADYFYDFFVPYADLGLSTEPVRIVAVTITSASSGISGQVSDFNGINDKAYGNNPTAIANALVSSFPPTPLSSLISGATFSSLVSLAPVVNSGINTSSTTISGTSTEANGTTITVYKNGTSIGTASVNNNSWTLTGVSGLSLGDQITAKATASGKSISVVSNTVTVTVVPSCYVAPPDIVSVTNSGNKKVVVHWSWPAGVTKTSSTVQVLVYQVSLNSSGGFSLVGASPQYLSVNASDTIQYALGGAGSVTGSYVATVVYGGCTSGYSSTYVSTYGGTTDTKTTTPTVLTTPIYQSTGSTSILVKNNHASSVSLIIYKNGVSQQTVNSIAAGANGTFSLTGLLEGDRIWARALSSATNYILSDTSNNVVVIASAVQSDVPVITGSYIAGSNKTISGTSTEQSGTVIYVYSNGTLIGTTTVTVYGTWSLSGVTLTAGNVLTAKAKASGETLSEVSNSLTVAASTPSAPTVTGSYQANGSSVSGNNGSGTVTIYIDGAPIGTVSSVSGAWTLSGIAYGQLYKGAKITATNTVSGVTSDLSNEVIVTGVVSFLITNTSNGAVANQTAGQAFNVKFTAKDGSNGSGNTVTGFTTKVVVSSTSAALTGIGSSSDFSAGVLASHTMNLTTAGVGKSITVVSVDDPTAVGSATFDILANSAASLVINQPADITAGARAAYTVTRKDAYGNLVTAGSLTVYLTVSNAAGKYYDASTGGNNIVSVQIPDGSATANFWFTSNVTGGYSITASDHSPADGSTGIADVQDDITVSAGTAQKYIVTNVSTALHGTAITVSAQLADQFDNSVETSGITVTWSSTNGGSYGSATSATNSNGVATIQFTVSNTSGVTHMIYATTGSISGSNSVLTTSSCEGYVWTGAANDNNFNNTSNWLCGIVPPTSGADIVIDPNKVCPLLTDIAVEDIVFQSGSKLDLNGHSLVINATATGTPIFIGDDFSDLTIGVGATVSSISFEEGYQTIHDLTINASTSLLTNLYISSASDPGTLTVGSGAEFTTNGNLVLGSSYNGTARVGQSYGVITGNVAVERYIRQNTSRGWRMLAVPIQGSQSIKASWQEGATDYLDDPNPGYGTRITAKTVTAVADGYDAQTYGNSLLSYNPGRTPSWSGVTSNLRSTAVSTKGGWMIYIRGDRTVDTAQTITAPSATVLQTKGTLYQGNQTVNTVDGFNIVGNLYTSEIDFTKLSLNRVSSSFYVWDPKLSGSYGLGGFQTFSAPDWLPTPGGGSYGSAPNTKIQSGMAFLVTSSASGSVGFSEAAKTTGSNASASGYRPAIAYSYMSTNLYAVTGGAASLADGNRVFFDASFSNDLDSYDIEKAGGFGEGIAMSKNGKLLQTERRQPVVDGDYITYTFSGLKSTTSTFKYRLEFAPVTMSTGTIRAFLEDAYLSTSEEIDLTTTKSVDFTVVSTNAATYTNRFKLVFRESGTVPVRFTGVKATQVSQHVKVDWSVSNEQGISKYDVERSSDGANFIKVGTIGSANSMNYSYTDNSPLVGVNYYRIRSIGENGSSSYTYIVKLMNGKVLSSITITDNVIKGGMLGLQFNNKVKGDYVVKVLTTTGQLLHQSRLSHGGGNAGYSISMSNVTKGLYHVAVIAPDGKTTVLKMIIE